jgi:hypothetical protein
LGERWVEFNACHLPWDYQATPLSSASTGTAFMGEAGVFLESILVPVNMFVMLLILLQ